MDKEKNILKLFKESLKNKRTWIPNLLTASRLFGTFVIPPLFFCGNYIGAAVAIAFFSATDFFDGKIARKYNGFSEFGRLLDPIVDKIFAIGLTLAVLPKVPLLAINLIPEIAIAIINSKSFHSKGNPKSSILGKLKTFFLFPTIGLCYVSTALNIDILNILTVLACVSTFAIQSVVTYDYYKKAKTQQNIVNDEQNENTEKDKDFSLEKKHDNDKELQKEETKAEALNIGLTRKEAIELLKEKKEEYFGSTKEEKGKTKDLKK